MSDVEGHKRRLARGGDGSDLDVTNLAWPALPSLLRRNRTGGQCGRLIKWQHTALEVFFQCLSEGLFQQTPSAAVRKDLKRISKTVITVVQMDCGGWRSSQATTTGSASSRIKAERTLVSRMIRKRSPPAEQVGRVAQECPGPAQYLQTAPSGACRVDARSSPRL